MSTVPGVTLMVNPEVADVTVSDTVVVLVVDPLVPVTVME
jgi:hypothetical protein